MNNRLETRILEILRNHVVPALGCTEPIAVALACARSSKECNGALDTIEVTVDTHTMKNALAVSLPGFNDRGLGLAAAAGALVAEPDKELMILKDLKKREIRQAKMLVSQGKVRIIADGSKKELYIQADIYSQNGHAKARIEGSHTNFTLIEVNGKTIASKENQLVSNRSFLEFLSSFEIAELIEIVEKLGISDLLFLLDGIDMVDKAAEEGLGGNSDFGYGTALMRLTKNWDISRDILSYVKIKAAAAGDARMTGMSVPIMSSFGSGNHGIVIYSCLSAVGKKEDIPKERLIRAIALTHLLVGVIKYYTGILTVYCGCTVGAGAAAAIGAVYLLGGTIKEMDNAFRLFLSGLAGIFCDGAKENCAQKVSLAAALVIESAYLALDSKIVPKDSGIIGENYRETLENLKTLADESMDFFDTKLLRILHKKQPEQFDIIH